MVPYIDDSDDSCASGTFHRGVGHTWRTYRWTCRSIPHTGQGEEKEVQCRKDKF